MLEGMDGSGKSTQCRMLSDRLDQNNVPYISLREPGGTETSELIRKWLSVGSDIDPITELFLLEAARSSLIHQQITPSLNSNKFIILDRFIYSTLAYQGFARGIEMSLIDQVNEIATRGLTPNKVFLMDLEPDVSIKRLVEKTKDRWESENLIFHASVRNGYIKLAQQNPGLWKIVDASRSAEEVHEYIWKYVKSLF